MDDRALLQQALEKMEFFAHMKSVSEDTRRLITTLRERLAQPEQEPVAYAYTGIKANGEQHGPHLVWKPEYMDAMSASMGAVAVPLYTAPQPAQQPLTDDRVWLEYMQLWPFRPNDEPRLAKDILRFARAIEAAHGITGATP